MKILLSAIFAVVAFSFSVATYAITPIDGCPNGFESATVDVEITVSTNLTECPLLEDRRLRRLVNRHGVGSIFAYPTILGTCLSGTDLTGTITTSEGVVYVTGSSESAQRLSTEAAAVNPELGGLFLTGVSQNGPFASGAGMTVVSIEGQNAPLNLQLVLSENLTIDLSVFPFVDTEDFLVVGAKGANVKGRLTGKALIYNAFDAPIVETPFSINGDICIK